MKRRQAFTLIELLVVIAIISLLLSVLVPTLKQAREHARLAVCKTNARSVNLAFHAYAAENAGAVVVFSDVWFDRAAGPDYEEKVDWVGVTQKYTGSGGYPLSMARRRYAKEGWNTRNFNLAHPVLFCPSDKWFPDGNGVKDQYGNKTDNRKASSYGVPNAVSWTYDVGGRKTGATGQQRIALNMDRIREPGRVVNLGEVSVNDWYENSYQLVERSLLLVKPTTKMPFYYTHPGFTQTFAFFDGHVTNSKLPPHALGFWFPYGNNDIELQDGTIIEADNTGIATFQKQFPK